MTKSLIRSIWDQAQDGTDDKNVRECVRVIRANTDISDPISARSRDPITFVYVFGKVLRGLVPRDVISRRKDENYKVMGELTEIAMGLDGLNWLCSRQRCVEYTYLCFENMHLLDAHLCPELKTLASFIP